MSESYIEKLRKAISKQLISPRSVPAPALAEFLRKKHLALETAAGHPVEGLPIKNDAEFIATRVNTCLENGGKLDACLSDMLRYFEGKYELDLRQHRLVNTRVENPNTRSNGYRAPSNERSWMMPEVVERGGVSETAQRRPMR